MQIGNVYDGRIGAYKGAHPAHQFILEISSPLVSYSCSSPCFEFVS
jgi:hypothetical protein